MWIKGNLTPTPAVDKNGRKTTVYRRLEAPSKNHPLIPAAALPSLPSNPPALSDVPTASAALMLLTMKTSNEDDRRSTLVREMVNSAMDDDEAVEFLSLIVMPLEMLEDVSEFIQRGNKRDASRHRQAFFRFANDAFFTMPQEQACAVVNNAMKVTQGNELFTESSLDRMKELHRVGIDYRQALEGDDLVTARRICFFVSCAILLSDEVGKRYFGQSETQMQSNGLLEFAYIKDDEVKELVLNSGDRFDAMLDVMFERDSCDPALLREVLENPSPAINDGIL